MNDAREQSMACAEGFHELCQSDGCPCACHSISGVEDTALYERLPELSSQEGAGS